MDRVRTGFGQGSGQGLTNRNNSKDRVDRVRWLFRRKIKREIYLYKRRVSSCPISLYGAAEPWNPVQNRATPCGPRVTAIRATLAELWPNPVRDRVTPAQRHCAQASSAQIKTTNQIQQLFVGKRPLTEGYHAPFLEEALA